MSPSMVCSCIGLPNIVCVPSQFTKVARLLMFFLDLSTGSVGIRIPFNNCNTIIALSHAMFYVVT